MIARDRLHERTTGEDVEPFDPAVVSFEDDGDEFHLFHGRVRYGRSTSRWRAALVSRMLKEPAAFPGAGRVTDVASARALIDKVTTGISIVGRALHELHGTPDLGNVRDPVAEIVFIVLCWRSRIPAARAALEELRAEFSRWEDILDLRSRRRLEEILRPGGFLTNKVTALIGIISRLVADFGAADLSPLQARSDDEVL